MAQKSRQQKGKFVMALDFFYHQFMPKFSAWLKTKAIGGLKYHAIRREMFKAKKKKKKKESQDFAG